MLKYGGVDGTQGFFNKHTPANSNNFILSTSSSTALSLTTATGGGRRTSELPLRSLALASSLALNRVMALRIHSLSHADINVPHIPTKRKYFPKWLVNP